MSEKFVMDTNGNTIVEPTAKVTDSLFNIGAKGQEVQPIPIPSAELVTKPTVPPTAPQPKFEYKKVPVSLYMRVMAGYKPSGAKPTSLIRAVSLAHDLRYKMWELRLEYEKTPDASISSAEMTVLWTLLLLVPAVLAEYEEKFKVSYDTVLQKKCESLKLWYDAAFIGDRCFAVSRDRFNTTLDKWFETLKSKCNHLYGYHAMVGNVYTEKQIDAFMEHNVLENNKKYFVGGRQTPTDEEAGVQPGDSVRHKERWFYVGDDGKSSGNAINSNLWIKGQPDNGGKPPETVLAIEKTADTNKLGYNDINPEADNYQVLCEYADFQICPTNWTLIESFCYKVYTDNLDYISARQKCRSDGGTKGRLAAIHNDRVNQLLADIARDNLQYARIDDTDRDLANNPVLFGLSYDTGAWIYDNGDVVDFFRWYDQAGSKIPRSGNPVLLNTLNNGLQGEARYTYWTMPTNPQLPYPYICQTDPTIS